VTVGPYDSQIYGGLFAEQETASVFSDVERVRSMLAVEMALARVQGALGIIPTQAANAIVAAAENLRPDMDALGERTARDGVPVVELVNQLRTAVGGDESQYVHWGATSQDIVDTAVILQLRTAVDRLEEYLDQLIGVLRDLANVHRDTLMAARTHSQQALPTTFGFKVASWLAPLVRHRQRLAQLKPRVFVIQFGGAVGTLAALQDQGIKVMVALAQELALTVPVLPWHTQRDSLAEFAGWLSLITGSLGKIGQDVILLAQSEIGEVREVGQADYGGSSTMPQKSNPIASEMIVAAARMNASLLSNMHHSQIAEQERATHGWQLEWLSLPQMVVCTAASLKHALYVVENMVIDTARMQQNVAESNGLLLAEAATFALAAHIPRPEAQKIVKSACQEVVRANRNLIAVLRDEVEAPIDWDALADHKRYLGATNTLIDRIIAATDEC